MLVRKKRRSRNNSAVNSEMPELLKLWSLRIMVLLGGHNSFLQLTNISNESMAEYLGLGEMVHDSGHYEQKTALTRLRKIHRDRELRLRDSPLPTTLGENISRLSKLVGLNETDCRIVAFAVFIHTERLLEEIGDCLGFISSGKVINVLSVILDLPEKDVRRSLSNGGILASSGLVALDRNGTSYLKNKLDLLSDRFADGLLYSDVDPVDLLRGMVNAGRSATLTIDDFRHIKHPLSILIPYLRHAIEIKKRGVNVLLYGDPGTGKSEFSRLVAKEMACEHFEVASEDDEGNPVEGKKRLNAFRAAQSFFAHRGAIILFDEVEDIFEEGIRLPFDPRPAQNRKGWINRMLEINKVPTIWVSNSVSCIDPAVIRRFDLVIELPIPPRSTRERIVRKVCGDLLPEESIQRIVEAESMAPAVISRAASVVNCVGGSFSLEELPKLVECLVGGTLKAQGHQPLKSGSADRLPGLYDPALINADADLIDVSGGLAKVKSGRICLYGPPGTGKTAFGRWLADQLDVPLFAKKASDLISKWVGGTEQNIAKAFREAEQEGALLLIDEVDSFLQDRRRAQHSWEISHVNEMLTQMESFPGVFIASTNLMKGLDQASLRRFDLKVKFDFLQPSQAWLLMEKHCEALRLKAPEAIIEKQLARLTVLTPGDFAAVARQNRFRPIVSAQAFINALEQECLVKEEGHRKVIGFL